MGGSLFSYRSMPKQHARPKNGLRYIGYGLAGRRRFLVFSSANKLPGPKVVTNLSFDFGGRVADRKSREIRVGFGEMLCLPGVLQSLKLSEKWTKHAFFAAGNSLAALFRPKIRVLGFRVTKLCHREVSRSPGTFFKESYRWKSRVEITFAVIVVSPGT